jgi:transposase
VDDFALRKGHIYGTVLVDMATGDPVDLLPDREAATLQAWLKAHPGARVICRDRAGAYAEGARGGAPEAAQVADRWHLWHNLAGCAAKTVAAHHGCLTGLPAGMPGPQGSLDARGRERPLVRRTRERQAEIHRRLRSGQSLTAISRATGLDRTTVRRFARAASADELLAAATSRESRLDPFKPYICQRWNQGITNAAVLHAELEQRGWTGSIHILRRYLRPFRQSGQAPGPAPPVPAPRQITRWLLTRPDRLTPGEQAQLKAIRTRCPHLDALACHVSAFAAIMTTRTGHRHLEAWLADVEADDQPALHSFANGIRSDQQAVTSGLTLPYSSGKVEGTVNKIKMIKRQMYGRASFPLLRKRVLLHPA